MRILVLSVDRDDDFGEKAGVRSPIIGRKANLEAAVKLALKDPEDSDTNALFSAVSLYDKLKKSGEDVQIATICGDKDVGTKSDKKLARELDYVLRKTKAKSVYLVSDGAEDDHIVPIISSRGVKIDHVQHVYVRQNRNIESSYYMVIKALKDDKIRKKITVPIALAMIFYGVLVGMVPFLLYVIINGIESILNQGQLLSEFTLGAFLTMLGMYMLSWAYSLDDWFRNLIEAYRKKVESGSATPYFTVVSIIFILFGIMRAWDAWTSIEGDLTKHFIYFLTAGMWWWVLGILLHEGGYVVDAYSMKGSIPKSFWVVTLSTMSMGLVLWAVLDSLKLILGYEELESTVIGIYASVAAAAFLIITAIFVGRAGGKKARVEAQWRK